MLMLKDDNFEEKTMNDSSSLLSNINTSNNVDFEKTKNILNDDNSDDNSDDNNNDNNDDNNNDNNDNNNDNINMNINDYTREDLYNILDLKNPNSNDIKVKIDLLKNTLFKKNNNVKQFLSNVEEKLLDEKSTIEEFANIILYKENNNNKEYKFEETTMIDSTSLLKNLNDNDNDNDFENTKNILKEINNDEYINEDINEDEDINNNINLNINDYTKEDLHNILELKNPTSNEIKIKIDTLKNTSFKEKNNVKKFLSEAEEKLLEENNYIEQY